MLISVYAYIPFFKSLKAVGNKEILAIIQSNQESFARDLPLLLAKTNERIRNAESQFVKPSREIMEIITRGGNLARIEKLCDFLEVKVNIESNSSEFTTSDGSTMEPDIINSITCSDLSLAMESILLITELAMPGLIHTLGGISVSSRYYHPLSAKPCFSDLLMPEEEDIDWPQLNNLDLIDTLKWCQDIGYGSNAFADDRISRALASLTHIIELGPTREGEILFRAMQGLEAFYCHGNGDLRRQLSEKSRMWLGDWSDSKNIVGQLYDMRSRFVHGSGLIEYANHNLDGWVENHQGINKQSYGTTLAVRMLIATLQKCIVLNTSNIDWTYAVHTNN